MLGDIVAALTNSDTAADIAAAICSRAMMDRINSAAAKEAVSPGALVSARVLHVIEHGGEDIWLDLVSAMAGSPQPGAVAAERMLAHAFPDPVRVRITRSGA
ncbi:MAG: hypothetical protein JSS43_26940 [Proteobacteria bacterium]|nr:hypothetical protein [Pseudomonadota bacterium]